MDADDKDKKAKNGPPEQQPPLVSRNISVVFDSTPFNQITEAIRAKQKAEEQEDETTNGFIERQSDAQEGANTISQRLFIINIFMFIATIMVFGLNYCGLLQTTKAADAAVRSDSISIAAYKWDSAKTSKASLDDSMRFERQMNTLEKHFEVENKAILVVERAVDSVVDGKLLVVYTLVNVGKTPAILDTIKGNVVRTTADNLIYFKYGANQAHSARLLLASGHFIPMFSERARISAGMIDSVKTKKIFYFFHGEVIYEDGVTNNKYVFRYNFRLEPNTSLMIMSNYNGIIEEPKK